MGQPEPVSRAILWVIGLLAVHAPAVNTLAVGVQAALGLCLLLGRFERAAIAASIPWSLGVWWIGEGFGALPTGFAVLAGGAPGPVLLYPLVGLLSWPRTGARGRPVPEAGPAAWSVLWVGGALVGLPWRFPAARMLQANIEQNGRGQPGWMSAVAHASYEAVGSHPLLVPCLLMVSQLAVGLGVLGTRTRPWAVAAGVALTVLFWVAVQDLGGLAAGGATDPGSGPLVVLLAVIVATGRHPCPTGARRRVGARGGPGAGPRAHKVLREAPESDLRP